jgi:hypothetical protein
MTTPFSKEEEEGIKAFKLACIPPSDGALTRLHAFGDDLPTWFDGHLSQEDIERTIYKEKYYSGFHFLNKERIGPELRPR